jgi:serralysin
MTQQHPIYEIAAKEIAYVFDNPQFNQSVNDFLKTTGYQLDRFFNDSSTGFQAVGLRSVLPANHDARAIGMNQFVANREAIAAWLNQAGQTTGQKPDVVGHSLGGAIAQIVATELMELVGEGVTFSSPGTSRSIAEQFLRHGRKHPTITHYIVDGDVVSLAGEAFIDGKAFLQSFTDPAIAPLNNLRKHQQIGRLLTSPPSGFTQTELSVKVLNHPAFTYFNSDYLEFLAAYAAIRPEIATQLTSRGKVEALRQADSSFQQIFLDIQNVLNLDKANLLVGDRQDNVADGAGGDDILIGKSGKDRLQGGTGKDFLVGVDLKSQAPGFQEIDTLSGGADQDMFVLGNKKYVFYHDGDRQTAGQNDYALITDFAEGDVIQLAGCAADYELKEVPQGLPTGIAIYWKQDEELIGVVQGKSNLELNSQSFRFMSVA